MLQADGKLCLNGCFKYLSRTEFGRHPRAPDGLASRCKACERDRLARRRHGLTAAEKAVIAAKQGGCAICQRPEPGGKGWVVDHAPAAARARDGYALDNPETLRRAADYLVSQVRLADASG